MPARSAAQAAKLVPSGRGGPRPGSGRPRNPPLPPITEDEVARVAATGKTPAEMARYFDARMVAALVQVAEHGVSESARVSACKELIRLGTMHTPAAPVSAATSEWAELLSDPKPN